MELKRDNILIRLVALLMGFLLWLHVATEETYHHQITLPLAEISLGDNLALAENPPDSITIVVSASGKQLLRQKWREKGLRLNATKYKIGKRSIDLSPDNISMVSPPTMVTIDEILLPANIVLSIDELLEKTVPVKVDIEAVPDDGYAVSHVSEGSPAEVTLRGPRSQLVRMEIVLTVPRKFSGLRDNIALSLPLVIPNVYGLTVTPDSTRVNIEVVPIKTRIFKNIPIVVYNAPPEVSIAIEPVTLEIELNGPPDEIDLLDRNTLIASVDFRNRRNDGQVDVKIDCPSNFYVRRTSVNRVTIIEN